MRLLFLCLLLIITLPALAQEEEQDDSIVKDSIYFTLDDGVMSEEEMREEAAYVHRLCEAHLYRRQYFNCECIAGAFLNEREKRGAMVLQETILTDLYRTGGETAKCGNAPDIAGLVFQECNDYARIFRAQEKNNQEYCQCAANRVARDFVTYPYLGLNYIYRLQVNAMLSCEERFPSFSPLY